MHKGLVYWVIIDSDNELSPIRWQSISTYTNADSLFTGTLVTNFRDVWIKTQVFSSKEMYLPRQLQAWVQLLSGKLFACKNGIYIYHAETR